MQVHRASDGATFGLAKVLAEYESIPELIDALESLIEIKRENILLFLEDGRELKAERLEEAWVGEGPSTARSRNPAIYVFDRESFWTDPVQWSRALEEELFQFREADDPTAAQSHINHLHSLLSHQSRALQIAHQSLSHHLDPLIREFAAFTAKADAALANEQALLKGSALDLALLPKIAVHDVFLAGKRPKTLGDYVHASKMEQVRDACRLTHDDHIKRFAQLKATIDQLATDAEQAGRLAEDKIRLAEVEFAAILADTEDVVTGMRSLSDSEHDERVSLHDAMAQLLETATVLKNDFTLELHLHLSQIAAFQSTITTIVPPLTALDSDLRSKGGFPHLHRLHNLPFAYAATVIEVVRRKEFSQFFLERTSALAEALAKVVNAEKKRRTAHRIQVLAMLPWDLGPVIDGPGPSVEMSVVGGGEALSNLNLSRADVQDLLKLLDSLEVDPEIQDSVEQGEVNPIPGIRLNLDKLLAKLDGVAHDFDKVAERAVLSSGRIRRRSSTDLHTMQELADQLREAEQAKADQDRALQARVSEFDKRERQLRSQHDEKLDVVQRRQAELQEELARLRHDMSEEVSMRQMLSTELEEKQREVDEHAELVTVLQADLAQEKDRANDLGVRLQEALLDFDGIKSQEESLRQQVDELRSERSTTLRHLSEAQMQSQDRESQVAGLRAEIAAIADQLAQARSDRDAALQQQSADAERMMRDHITEADGDRAVLEHQNLTLTSELERLKADSQVKIAAAKSAAVREKDGLKAELAFAKAQLRESTRRETVLADELATAKDTSNAASQKEARLTERTREAVRVAMSYHECNSRILTAINSSATISGTASLTAPRPASPKSPSVASADDQSESILSHSLATAASFDLEAFADAVNRTMNLVRKWQKSCKQYREQAKHKIAFANFTKGDLALFLPTRNSTAKSWAAFNISAPHNFLKMTDAILDRMQGRDFVVARIVKSEEAMVTAEPDSNPYGLAEGLRYYTHTVEEYDPAATRARRGTLLGREGATPGRTSTIDSAASPPICSPSPPHSRKSSEYFSAISMTSAAMKALEGDDNVVQPGAIGIPSRGPSKLISRHGSAVALSSSQTMRDHVPLNPASDIRPASVASSSSSHPGRGLPGPKAKAAPAMAVTTSHGAEEDDVIRKAVRKTASTASLSQAIPHKEPASSSHALGSSPPSSTGFASSIVNNFRSRAGSSNSRRPSSLFSPGLHEAEGTDKGSAADLLKRIEKKR